MSFFSSLFGSGPSNEQFSTLTPEQQQLLQQLISGIGGQGPLSGLFGVDQESFQKSFVDPAMNTFNNRTAPAIQQRFIASGGARSSSAEDTLTRAGADVQGQLNQTLAGLINQAQGRAMQGLGLGLGTQAFQNVQDPGSTGLFGELFSGVGSGFAAPFGNQLGKSAAGFFSRGGNQGRRGQSR